MISEMMISDVPAGSSLTRYSLSSGALQPVPTGVRPELVEFPPAGSYTLATSRVVAVVELLVEVCKVHGAGLLLISHHEDTVERMADDVVRLSVGGE